MDAAPQQALATGDKFFLPSVLEKFIKARQWSLAKSWL